MSLGSRSDPSYGRRERLRISGFRISSVGSRITHLLDHRARARLGAHRPQAMLKDYLKSFLSTAIGLLFSFVGVGVIAVIFTEGKALQYFAHLPVLITTIVVFLVIVSYVTHRNVDHLGHLPFDQQYDKAKIVRPGEFYCSTVKEAEGAGFRRALRWRGIMGQQEKGHAAPG